jgi:hypothetical protein
MTSPWGKLTKLVWHPTKTVKKAEQITYFSTNIDITQGKEPSLKGKAQYS